MDYFHWRLRSVSLTNMALYTRVKRLPGFCSKVNYFKLNKVNVTTEARLRDNEYTQVPEYPPIFDPSKKGRKLTDRLNWYQSIRNLSSVDEKLLEIANKYIKKGGLKAHILDPEISSYDDLNLYQYCTQTKLIHGLPQQYYSNVDDVLSRVREPLLETIKIQKLYRSEKQGNQLKEELKIQEERSTNSILNELVFQICSSIGCENDHVATAEIIESPSCSSYWWHGDYYANKLEKENLSEICFQYQGKPALQLRISKPLPSVVDRDDPLSKKPSDLPKVEYHPSVYGKHFKKRHVTSVPGFWNGNTAEFPFLTLSNLSSIHYYNSRFTGQNREEAIISKGIITSFGWLMGIAANLGFTVFDEITYPLTTQTILTNGKEWWFFVYQLNTIALHKDTNPHIHNNIMWYSGPINLYESIEDGVLKGTDDEVLKLLLQFFIRKPLMEVDFETKPFLRKPNISEEERKAITNKLRRLYDNRPHHMRHKWEIPTWHHVYKRNKVAAPTPQIKLW